MFDRLGRIVPRLRFVFIALWAVLAIGFGVFAPALAKVGSADETSFLPSNAESLTAQQLIRQAFPSDAAASQAQIVFSRPTGLTDADRAYIDGLGDWLMSKAPAEVRDTISGYVTAESHPELASSYRSSDGIVEMSRVDFNVASFQATSNAAIDGLREHLSGTAPKGLAAQVTGQAGIGRDYLQAIKDGTDRTTIVTVILVIVILLLIYRAPLAALVPLITIGAAFLVARGVLGFLAQAGWHLSTILDSFIVVLVFGVGTDYTIFLISRFREELTRAPFREAIVTTVARIAAVITASAATVIVGLGAMAVARFGMIQTTGPALAITVFVTLLAGLTLTPSLLSIFGRRLFWPLHEQTRSAGDETRGFWAGVGRTITARPGLLSLVVLVVLALPLLNLPYLTQSFDVLSELPKGSEARQGFDTMSDHLGKGQLLPITVLIKSPGTDLTAPESLQKIGALQGRIAVLPDVGAVRSIVTAGSGSSSFQPQPSRALGLMAAALTSSSTASPATAIGPAAETQLASMADYLAGLGKAFPSVASSDSFKGATSDVAALKSALPALRQQARVSTQLTAIADRLQASAAALGPTPPIPSSSASPGASGSPAANPTPGIPEAARQQLQVVGAYLQELGSAYPEVTSTTQYAAAAGALQQLQAGQRSAFPTLLSSLRGLASIFDARPTDYLFPKSIPASPQQQQAEQQLTQTKSRLATELGALAKTFAALPNDYYVPTTGATGTSMQPLVNAYDSAARDVTRLYVTTRSDPYATSAFDTIRQLRDLAATSASQFSPGTQILVGGATAQFADIQTTMNEDFVRVAIITIVCIFLILTLLLRSLLAPIYLVATVLLSYGTSLCLSSFLLDRVFGISGMNYFIPLIVFVLLVALGSDYNIFLMARVREEASARGVRPGIRVASARTGTVITSAGLILAGTFGALVTSPLALLLEVGFAVALGVLIDTFVVRSLLVPAITAFLGEWSWWPFHSGAPAAAVATGGGGTAPLAGQRLTPRETYAIGPAASSGGAGVAAGAGPPASAPEPEAAAPGAAGGAAAVEAPPTAVAVETPAVAAAIALPAVRSSAISEGTDGHHEAMPAAPDGRVPVPVRPRAIGPIHVPPPARAGHLVWIVPAAVGGVIAIRRLLRRR